MTVSKLKAKHRGPWCDYCQPDTRQRATHRGYYFTRFACADHLEDLAEYDRHKERMDRYETEAERSIPWV